MPLHNVMGFAAKRMGATVAGLRFSRPLACGRLSWSLLHLATLRPPGAACWAFSYSSCLHWRPLVVASPWHANRPAARGLRSKSLSYIRAQLADNAPTSAGPKVPARLALKQQELNSQVVPDVSEPVPKISLEHVTLSFARSGGAGGQNVNKVNTKVDMRFNVMGAIWLPLRVRAKLMQMEKNRINTDGELFISSTKTRTQKGNIDDALDKLQQLIDAAAYEPPPVSEEKKKRIAKLAKADNERRLEDKKRMASKKTQRRAKGSWD